MNAATISADAMITGGTRSSRPSPYAAAATIAQAASTVRLMVSSGRLLSGETVDDAVRDGDAPSPTGCGQRNGVGT